MNILSHKARIEAGFVKNFLKSLTFTGAAGLGAVGNCVLFTVTGAIHLVSIDAVCKTTVTVDGGTGAASLSLGIVNSTVLFIAATTANTITSTDKHWQSATPTANGIAQAAAQKDIDISQNIVAAVTSSGTQIVNGGVIDFRVIWFPISSDGNLV